MSIDPREAKIVHVIEPTLEDYAGHCYGLVRSFCDAVRDRQVVLWGGQSAATLAFAPTIRIESFFRRRLRLFQLWWLLRRLLADPAPVVVMTARRADLALVNLATRKSLPSSKLYLYFHWYRKTPERLAFLRKAASAQPQVEILATTRTVADIFSEAGFKRVTLLPYPLTARPWTDAETPDFRHIVYAGAARQDKGFGRVVALAEQLAATGEKWKLAVQISPEHYGKLDQRTRSDIERLERLDYAGLTLIRAPLGPEDYAGLYRGAICLQPYEPEEFRDRVSGVTMDALANGCPVIVPAGTWMARIIEPFSAGVASQALDPGALLEAVRTIADDYPRYTRNAMLAGVSLRNRSWSPLLSRLPDA
jgi:glycosyltransferase involved in cell wall biosynthesis